MKNIFFEPIVFLTVGLISAISGGYALLNINFQESSIWWIIWNLIRLAIGIMAIAFGLKGIFGRGE